MRAKSTAALIGDIHISQGLVFSLQCMLVIPCNGAIDTRINVFGRQWLSGQNTHRICLRISWGKFDGILPEIHRLRKTFIFISNSWNPICNWYLQTVSFFTPPRASTIWKCANLIRWKGTLREHLQALLKYNCLTFVLMVRLLPRLRMGIWCNSLQWCHMSVMTSQITGQSIVWSAAYSWWKKTSPGPLSLTWMNFNPSIDK